MAIKFTSVKCPECGANLPIEIGRDRMFCSYCGTQIIVTNENEHIIRTIDEADLKKTEIDKLIKLKKLEMKAKEDEVKRKRLHDSYKIAGIAVFVGFILICFGVMLPGVLAIVIGATLALYSTIFNGDM